MNIEDLYLGEIRRVEENNKTRHINYTILKKLKNGHYQDVLSLLRKTYKTTFEAEGNLYINTDYDYLIPYYEAINKTNIKQNKTRHELKEELKKLKKDLEIEVSNVFIGYIVQATSVINIPGKGDSSLDRFLTSSREILYTKLKKSIFLKKSNTYLDLLTGIKYSNDAFIEGDLFVPEKLLSSINFILPEEERCTTMPKRKILRKYEEVKKGSENSEK